MEELNLMEGLNVNFKELEHMDLDKAKEIVSHFDNEDDFEELGATIDGVEYGLDIIDEKSNELWEKYLKEKNEKKQEEQRFESN